jgi:hypothetical protein
MSKLTNVQQEELKKLMEQQTPIWCTKDLYDKLISEWDTHKMERSLFITSVLSIFSVSYEELIQNPKWKCVSFRISPSILLDRYNKGLIFSTPATGQDPKTLNDANQKSAAFHAGRQWGDIEGSFWINFGTFNLVQYPNGKMVLEPTDVEHRLWALIGFQLGLIELKSDELLYFYHSLIEGGKISVNNLKLSEIIEKANNNLKKGTNEKITEEDILKRFNKGTFPVTILPMYDEKSCHNFFREINSSDEKSKPQILHAKSEESNLSIKKFSSIKNERFSASDDELHPFYKHCFNEKSKVDLDTLMISHLICQYIYEDDFIPTSDSPIYESYIKPNGYKDIYDLDMEMECINTLNYLYDIFKYRRQSNPSRQQILQILKLNSYIESENLFIYDKEKFINSFYEFLDNHQTKDNPLGGKPIKLSFYTNMNSSDYNNLSEAHDYIKTHFLSNGDAALKYSKDILDDIGIMIIGSKVPRLFKQYVIDKSKKDNKGLDIDNKPFTEKPVGGHIISDFELLTLSDDQRSEVFSSEGLGTKFIHDKNCRAMSSYHNLRMGVLRLSEYMNIINESDEVIKEAIKNKKIEVKKYQQMV